MKNKYTAFSLAEMMVVMLILSIVMSASMPIITKRSRNTTPGIPTGTIIAYAGSTAPTGWLLCNHSSTAGYPALKNLVGDYTPDLRGEFIRGLDNGRGVDTQSNRAIGSWEPDMVERHQHSITTYQWGGSINNQGSAVSMFSPGYRHVSMQATDYYGAPTDVETRPRNLSFNYIIKT